MEGGGGGETTVGQRVKPRAGLLTAASAKPMERAADGRVPREPLYIPPATCRRFSPVIEAFSSGRFYGSPIDLASAVHDCGRGVSGMAGDGQSHRGIHDEKLHELHG